MRGPRNNSNLSLLFVLLLLLPALPVLATRTDEGDWLEQKVRMADTRGTVYQLLRQVSEQTNYLFIYDSRIINNDSHVELHKKEYTLREVIYAITGNHSLSISLVGSHILLSLPVPPGEKEPARPAKTEKTLLVITGAVFDQYTKEPVPSVTLSVSGASIGTVANQSGQFRLLLPDSLRQATLRVSHIGYEYAEIKVNTVAGQFVELSLEPKIIPLQEVVVRPVNPLLVLEKMLAERARNYSAVPVHLTSFYREAIERKNRNVDLTESVLKLYKTAYDKENGDMVKLIKMRHVFDMQEKDTLMTKMKSGIQSSMLLDIMKALPDFLDLDVSYNPYEYMHVDFSVIGGRLVNVISFEQKKENTTPLYKGLLYIDAENYALLEARFEVNPAYAKKATALFVEKKSRLYNLTLRRAAYVVSYKPGADGIYYLNYIRGDIEFRVKKKRHLFSSSLDVWFETVTCDIDKENAVPFSRSERISPRTVFSETMYEYDAGFWENFNVILPEEELKKLIMNNLSRVSGSTSH